jgi:ribosomal-protein-alanine N-acetyltransferase
MTLGDPTILETPRLILRVFGLDDVDALEQVHGDQQIMRFSVGGVKTKDQIVCFIENSREGHRRDRFSQRAVVWRETGSCIGECGILPQVVDGISEHEISYRLNRNFWGRGIATEAAIACRIYGFEILGLDRVISIIDPGNVASIRVAEKAGMRPEKDSVFHGIPVRIYAAARPVSHS